MNPAHEKVDPSMLASGLDAQPGCYLLGTSHVLGSNPGGINKAACA